MNNTTLLQTSLFPLAAAGLLATGMTAANFSESTAERAPIDRVIDLPAVTVQPEAHDLAYYRRHRIVDLPRITVRPELAELAADSIAAR